MSEKEIFYAIIGANVLLYILAFALACVKKQKVTFYIALLVIEALVVLPWIIGDIEHERGIHNLERGIEEALRLIWLIAFTLVLSVAIFLKTPSWYVAAYILITIGLLFVIDAIMDRQSAKQLGHYKYVREILRNNEYTVLNEEIDAKIQEKMALKEEIED